MMMRGNRVSHRQYQTKSAPYKAICPLLSGGKSVLPALTSGVYLHTFYRR